MPGRRSAVYAETGLARLGFGRHDSEPLEAGSRQVTSLRIRKLARPLPGTSRAELSEEERIGQAVLRLVAAYAMHLMGSDRTRHKVLGFDEAWFLLGDAVGRRLIEHLNRWARSEFATPILVTAPRRRRGGGRQPDRRSICIRNGGRGGGTASAVPPTPRR